MGPFHTPPKRSSTAHDESISEASSITSDNIFKAGNGRVIVPHYQDGFMDEFALPQGSQSGSVLTPAAKSKSSSQATSLPPLPSEVVLPNQEESLSVVGISPQGYKGRRSLFPLWLRRAPRTLKVVLWGGLAFFCLAAIVLGVSLAKKGKADDGNDTLQTDWRNTVATWTKAPSVAPMSTPLLPSPFPSTGPSFSWKPSLGPTLFPTESVPPSSSPSSSALPTAAPSRSALPSGTPTVSNAPTRPAMNMRNRGAGRAMGPMNGVMGGAGTGNQQEQQQLGMRGTGDSRLAVLEARTTTFPTFSPPRARG